MQSTGILVAANVFFILLVYHLENIGTLNLILLLFVLATLLTGLLYAYIHYKRRKAADQVVTKTDQPV